MQRTPDPSLVQDNSTGWEATKPIDYNCWTSRPEPVSLNYWSLSALEHVLHNKDKPPLRGAPSQLESSSHSLQLKSA